MNTSITDLNILRVNGVNSKTDFWEKCENTEVHHTCKNFYTMQAFTYLFLRQGSWIRSEEGMKQGMTNLLADKPVFYTEDVASIS